MHRARRLHPAVPAIVIWIAIFSLWIACGDKQTALAKLTKATDGPVERQAGSGEDTPWRGAGIGTKFFLGDAARTADGTAELELVGNALIAMQPRTVLRFGGDKQASKIMVEAGAIDLTGTGSYATALGDVKLSRNGTVRITAKGDGNASILLTLGEAQVSTVGGETINLVLGQVVDINLTVTGVTAVIDAAVPEAVADAAPDAPVDIANAATIVVTGKNARVQPPGVAKPKPLPAGESVIEKGTKVLLGNATTAKLTLGGTTLDMGGGSRVLFDEKLGFVLELGDGRASSTAEMAVALPGGAIRLDGSSQGASEAKLAVNNRDTKVTIARGTAKLTGNGGSELAMSRGESATLARSGLIRVLEAIPNYFDFRIIAGETLTIHDPKPPTAVQFQFGGKCPAGGIIEMDRDHRFRTAKVSGGKEAANHSVSTGGWAYRLRCTAGGGEGQAVASGRIVVVRDGGTRPLPKAPPLNRIETDGRNYRIDYQSVIPNIEVKFQGAASKFTLHLAQGGTEQTFETTKQTLIIKGNKLKEGQYTFWFDRDGVKQPKVAILTIGFDQTAAQVYIEAPSNGKPWSEGDIDVKGATLPGWTAVVEGNAIPIDARTRRFNAKVQRPPGTALAIKLQHPQRGVHYYVRRQK